MTDSEKRNRDGSGQTEEKIDLITEVDRENSSGHSHDGTHDLTEAVAPAADAADVLHIAISANESGEPSVSPPLPPGAKSSNKDGEK